MRSICNKACENWDPKLPIKRVMLVFIYLAVGQKGIVFIYLLSMNINYQYFMPVEFMIKINITCGYFHLLIRSQIVFSVQKNSSNSRALFCNISARTVGRISSVDFHRSADGNSCYDVIAEWFSFPQKEFYARS